MTVRTDNEQWHHRADRGELHSSHERADGTLLVEGFAAREGILVYRDAAGRETREYVSAKTLRESSLTLGRSPVTLGHPHEDVTPDNFGQYAVGDVDGEVHLDNGFVRVKMAIRKRDAIDAVRSGTQQLSCGYTALIDPTPGHNKYGRYDSEQIARENNHLAIVPAGRAGPEARVRVDTATATTVIADHRDAVPPETPGGIPPRGATVNPRFLRLLALAGVSRADSVTTDDAALDAACNALEARADAAVRNDAAATASKTAEATAQAATLTAMTTARDTEKARADAAEARLATLQAAETARADAAARVELETIAAGHGIDPSKHADTKALARVIAGKAIGAEVKADASDDYVAGLVAAAKKSIPARADAAVNPWAPNAPGPARNDDGQPVPAPYLSPSQLSAKRADDAFNAARSGGAK